MRLETINIFENDPFPGPDKGMMKAREKDMKIAKLRDEKEQLEWYRQLEHDRYDVWQKGPQKTDFDHQKYMDSITDISNEIKEIEKEIKDLQESKDPFQGPDPKEVKKREKALGDWIVTTASIDWKEDWDEPWARKYLRGIARQVGGEKVVIDVYNEYNDSKVVVISSKKMTKRQAQNLFDAAPIGLSDGFVRGNSYSELVKRAKEAEHEEVWGGTYNAVDETKDPFQSPSEEDVRSRKRAERIPELKRLIQREKNNLRHYQYDRDNMKPGDPAIDEWEEEIEDTQLYIRDLRDELQKLMKETNETKDPFKSPNRADVDKRRLNAFQKAQIKFKPGTKIKIDMAYYHGGDDEKYRYGVVKDIKQDYVPDVRDGRVHIVSTGIKLIADVDKGDGTTTWWNNIDPDTVEIVENKEYRFKEVLMEDIFQGADPDDVQSRKEDYVKNQRKRMFAKAEAALPGSVEKLKAHFGNDDLVETAIAYCDSSDVVKVLNPETTNRWEPLNIRSPFYSVRDLDWDGFWTDAKTFLKQADVVGGYNVFCPEIAKDIVDQFGDDREYRLARESSVAVYVRPVGELELPYQYDVGQDEMGLDPGTDELRLWWD